MYNGNVVLALIFLFSSAILAGITTSLLRMGRLHAKEIYKKYGVLVEELYMQNGSSLVFQQKSKNGEEI